jgi:hypothetical protein
MAGKQENKYLKNRGKVTSYLGLNKGIDLTDFPTSFALAASIVIAVVTVIVNAFFGVAFEDGAYLGLILASTYFFTWLLANELDPGRRVGGLIGGFIALAMYFVLGSGNPIVLLWLMFIVRMFNRTTGSGPQMGDNVIIIFMAYYLSRGGFWLYPVVTGLAYAADSQLKRGSFRNLYLAALCFGITAISSDNLATTINLNLTYVILMGVTVVLFLPAISMATYVKGRDERNNFDLDSRRIQAGQAAFLFGSILISWFSGNSQAVSFAPAWAGAIGIGLYLFYIAVQNSRNKSKDDKIESKK